MSWTHCQRDAAALWAVFTHTHDLRDYAPLFFVVVADQALRQDADEKGWSNGWSRKPLMASSANPAFLPRRSKSIARPC